MNFRLWCKEKWFEYRDEILMWGGKDPIGSEQEYFAKYKWWLKREYQFQRNKDNA
jgi:hypothetical protein